MKSQVHKTQDSNILQIYYAEKLAFQDLISSDGWFWTDFREAE